MAGELKDRLTDLAVHTPPGSPPPDLWTRGVRRKRAGQALTSVVVVVLLLLLVGAGGLAWSTQRRAEPVAPHGEAQLPDRFYAPSPWLDSFSKPPGPLIAILPAERKSLLHTEQGLVGITAAGSSYGFLDLPHGAVVQQGVRNSLALSPDGTHIAFWVTGKTGSTPNTLWEDGATVTGVGTYDTVTGQARVFQIPSAHGLMRGLLVWSDDTTLVFGYGQTGDDGRGGGSKATYVGAERWDAGASQPTALPDSALQPGAGTDDTSAARGMLLTPARARQWQLLDPHQQVSPQPFSVKHPANNPELSPDLRSVIGREDPGSSVLPDHGPLTYARIVPGDVHDRAVTSFERVPAGGQWYTPVGWRTDARAVALRRLPEVGATSTGDLMAELDWVNVHTGAYARLAGVERGANVADPSNVLVAQSLLGAPVAHVSPPPSPPSQRLIWPLVTAIVVLGLVLISRIRRGRRA